MIDVPVQVKDALREGDLRKNYRFLVLNDDGTTDFIIDNNNLVKESVKIDERMNSGDTLKFGLCEGSSLEFQYFDHDNITGRRIKCFIDVQYEGYSGIDITTLSNNSPTYTCDTNDTYKFVVQTLFYQIYLTIKRDGVTIHSVTFDPSGSEQSDMFICQVGDVISFGSASNTTTMKVQRTVKDLFWHSIPMGYFTVKNCSRQASTGIQKVIAYNKLQSSYLDQKANQMIIDLAADGMPGASDHIDVGYILSHLLDEYAIEQFTKVRFNNPVPPPSWQMNTHYTYYRVVSGGSLTTQVITLGSIRVQLNTTYGPVNPDSFYKLRANLQRLVDAAKLSYDPSYYLITGYLNLTVKDITTSDTSSVGTTFKLGDLIEGKVSESDNIYTMYAMMNTQQFPNARILEIKISEHPSLAIVETDWTTGITNLVFDMPVIFRSDTVAIGGTKPTFTDSFIQEGYNNVKNYLISQNDYIVKERVSSEADLINFTYQDALELPDVTLRDLQSAVYEFKAQYGQLNRNTDLFEGVELKKGALYPADTIYPLNSRYPGGVRGSSFRSWYSKLWTDAVSEQSFRNLIITYKGLDNDNNPIDYTYEVVVDPEGTTDYIMDDNWLFKNLIWTQQQIEEYAAEMVIKMQDLSWFPFEMWCAGLPYIETGDEIEIIQGDQTYTSYILQRQLNGIQNLQDTYINGTLDIF